jgi:sulfite reductase subunit B
MISAEKTTLSPWKIKKGKILSAKWLTELEKVFEIQLPNGEELGHEPGQFVQASVFGVGEAPISICSSPSKNGTFELCVRKAGRVVTALHKLETGDEIGIRGPFGKGFCVRTLEGNDLLFVIGGLGLAPARSLINYVMDNRKDFGKVDILLGCKAPENILFKDDIETWKKQMDVNFSCTVDKADPDWKGNVGLITTLIPDVNVDLSRTYAVIIGPPIMYKFVIAELLKKKLPEKQILMSLERHMKCGVGKCGHCQMDDLYCCQDGPVFSYDKVKHLKKF